MLFVRPDFYDDFICRASACRHSCCVGWEIDIDGESLARYEAVEGSFGDELRACIDRTPSPHFRLAEGDCCPLLRADGLCRLILALGEDSLCDICASHPRFYNEAPGRIEAGLGLCCEEAARLLCASEAPLLLLAEDDGEAPLPSESDALKLRGEIFAVLAEKGDLRARLSRALGLVGAAPPAFRPAEAAVFLLRLERMDEAWTALLRALPASVPREDLSPVLGRVAAYLVYRHFPLTGKREAAADALRFCRFSVELIAALSALAPLEEVLRLWSAEIEYSDENTAKIIAWLKSEIA